MKEVHATSSVIVGNIYPVERARSIANSAPSVNFVILTFVDHVHLSNAQANIAICCMSTYICSTSLHHRPVGAMFIFSLQVLAR